MAFTETSIVDKIECLENGVIQVRTATRILKDDEKVGESFHRHVILPSQDYSNEDLKVQAICAAVHTPEVIAAYQASQETE